MCLPDVYSLSPPRLAHPIAQIRRSPNAPWKAYHKHKTGPFHGIQSERIKNNQPSRIGTCPNKGRTYEVEQCHTVPVSDDGQYALASICS